MLFTKKLVTNSRVAQDHLRERDMKRNAANINEIQLSKANAAVYRGLGLETNAGQIPADVYRAFDNITIERMRLDDGDTYLNDLMPLAKSVNIGKLVHENRRSSDAGTSQTSMGGQVGIKFDQVEYNYDGAIVPIHDNGFFRNFRELAAQKSEGFDSLIDDQRETVANLREHLADTFIDGHLDADGKFLKVKGYDWQGMKNDSRVAQIDLGVGGVNFDFTDSTKTGDEIKAALIEVRNVLTITNKCSKDLTVYVSEEISAVWEENFSTLYESKATIEQLAQLRRIASIKVSNKLVGNELMLLPLDGEIIRPLSGMGMSTFALPRPLYNSNHEFVTAMAVGWQVNTDYFGNTCVGFAQA
jgi:hypothetical protein